MLWFCTMLLVLLVIIFILTIRHSHELWSKGLLSESDRLTNWATLTLFAIILLLITVAWQVYEVVITIW